MIEVLSDDIKFHNDNPPYLVESGPREGSGVSIKGYGSATILGLAGDIYGTGLQIKVQASGVGAPGYSDVPGASVVISGPALSGEVLINVDFRNALPSGVGKIRTAITPILAPAFASATIILYNPRRLPVVNTRVVNV